MMNSTVSLFQRNANFQISVAKVLRNRHHQPLPLPLITSTCQNRNAFFKHYSTSSGIRYQKTNVFDCDMNYVEMDGNPDHVVFIMPGSLSSIEQDFISLLQNLNPQKFKAIAYDPPGYGRSRPPNRWEIGEVVAQKDAAYATELLQKLGYKKYSLLGWSMGASSATVIAATNPERVRKLVAWGMGAYFDDVSRNVFKTMANMGITCLPKERLAQLIDMYGEEDLKKMFDKWVTQSKDEEVVLNYTKDGPFTKLCLNQVTAPTLIIRGAKDGFIAEEHLDYIHKNIKGSKTHVIKNGHHATHLQPSAQEFLTVVQQFLDADS